MVTQDGLTRLRPMPSEPLCLWQVHFCRTWRAALKFCSWPADQSRPPATNKVQRRAARHSHGGVNWPRQIPAPGLRLGPQVVGRVALEIERPALANDALV